MAPTLDFRNTNSLWCSVLAETLARCGVRLAVCSPGSRSTALTVAFAEHPQIEALPMLDERAAAFFALGVAKRTRVPTVLVCTSGSAAANYLPAVVEASMAQVPLLVLTADRPPELRACTSGQTIDQQRLYGSYTPHFVELAIPEASRNQLAYLRQTMAFAFTRALSPVAGPVHLNLPFRDPLPPVADGTVDGLRAEIDEAFFAHLRPASLAPETRHRIDCSARRGLIVAGTHFPAAGETHAEDLLALQRATGWPLLADPLSPLRSHAGAGVVVTAYDAILRTPEAAAALRPDFVLCAGAWPTSKVLRKWIQDSDAEVVQVSPALENRDALHGRTVAVTARPGAILLEHAAPADPAYANAWQVAETAARSVIDGALADCKTLFEPVVLWRLAQATTPAAQVFVANSMPVRDAEYVMPARPGGPQVFCNRGANGIDGNVSTALGLAHRGPRTVAVVGDLAFLHDGNALLNARHVAGSLVLIVINNRGGGIFQHLPIATADVPFRDFFLTPQDADIGRLCAAFGVPHRHIDTVSALHDALAAPAVTGVSVIEVETDSAADAAERRALFSRAAEAVRAALAGQSR
ncbi:2-succinyl-5-enolpyruvyl-6-hydroxy-3-cyclohexene-1-carboxylic-acid synthase [Nibricoccus sp. IMCC34717]|uniref:2-succinyl-5-enolpyruvyl-6-hydroxy-3- cyclohexene-1-carboxylic-acid synthase n=1 Tax=Nibricoccus sp. IMCC34717 TaxID=3034021 RepID=UPI0038503B43